MDLTVLKGKYNDGAEDGRALPICQFLCGISSMTLPLELIAELSGIVIFVSTLALVHCTHVSPAAGNYCSRFSLE